ncbi:MAG: hypothetical protein O3C68_09675 [Proteobacteria bacterium]|nr:hypothetical protein [Pseudomonadota bacterium]
MTRCILHLVTGHGSRALARSRQENRQQAHASIEAIHGLVCGIYQLCVSYLCVVPVRVDPSMALQVATTDYASPVASLAGREVQQGAMTIIGCNVRGLRLQMPYNSRGGM